MIRAKYCDVAHAGTGYATLSDMKDARAQMKKAVYNLAMAVASAEGDETIGQMKANLEEFERRNMEGTA